MQSKEAKAAAERARRKRPEVKAQAVKRRADPEYREQARLRAAQWREANRERDRQNARDYAEGHREDAKGRSAQWRTDNPDRVREQQADHYRRNAEKKKAQQAQRRIDKADELREQRRLRRINDPLVRQRDRANKALRKARKLGAATHPFTLVQLAAKTAYWGDRCWVCRGEWSAIDHVKPLARGGAHMVCNFRPICTTCNSAKGAKWPLPSREEILRWKRLLDANRPGQIR